MMADVPVGILLSGGVDSSAVLSYAVQGTEKKVKTFTVGFDGGQVVDERPFARLVARRFGTEHYDLSITAEDFWNFLPAYVWHMEEPVCEPPAVALYYVSRFARQHVKVLLSGEGGDEAFAGYPNYPNMLRLDHIRSALGPLARPTGAAAALVGALFGMARVQRYGNRVGTPFGRLLFQPHLLPFHFPQTARPSDSSRRSFWQRRRHFPPQTPWPSCCDRRPTGRCSTRWLYADTRPGCPTTC